MMLRIAIPFSAVWTLFKDGSRTSIFADRRPPGKVACGRPDHHAADHDADLGPGALPDRPVNRNALADVRDKFGSDHLQ
jgi:hypothetical protein